MTGSEIKKIIDNNNKKIEELLQPNYFTLNTIVSDLLAENRTLQKQCQHKFQNGYCIYCYLPEKE